MKIPFGLRTHDQRMVDPSEVANGKNCGCCCPECGEKLIARQGSKQVWNFAHQSGADCAKGYESAIHRMAKQMILERAEVWVPERRFDREVLGPRDDVDGGYSWKEPLSFVVCTEGIKTLTNCIEEKQVETRRPDLLASLEGQPIAIEIAYTHFCDEAKLDWLKARNLTALEIDVGMSPDTEMADIRPKLEARLFSSSPFTTWLVHSDDDKAYSQINAAENHLRAFNTERDAAFLKEIERKRAEKKRKDDFKERIKDIDSWTRKINRDLTLRIAYSRIRCTLKWHGHIKSVPESLKQATLKLAQEYGGDFNKTYEILEFRTPENQAKDLYNKLIVFLKEHFESHELAPTTYSNSVIQNKRVQKQIKSESILEQNERQHRESCAQEHQKHMAQLMRTPSWRSSLPGQDKLQPLMDEFCKAADFPMDKGFQFFCRVKTRADLRGTTPESYAILLEEQLGEHKSRWMAFFEALDLLLWHSCTEQSVTNYGSHSIT